MNTIIVLFRGRNWTELTRFPIDEYIWKGIVALHCDVRARTGQPCDNSTVAAILSTLTPL